MNKLISRRGMLMKMAHVSFGSVFASMAVIASDLCADPTAMDSGQQSLRMSLHYTEQATDQTKICSACGFFRAVDPACGMCMIFGGPVNTRGHCDSWSAKA
jgi:hypothetical protein